MKTRTGFVSNSSSSSFILIARASYFDEKLDSLDEKTKKVALASMDPLTHLGPGLCVIKARDNDGWVQGLAVEEDGSEHRIYERIRAALRPSRDERHERTFWQEDDS